MAAGVSYSRLRGEPAVSQTSYEYDDAGRVAVAVTVTEPEWSDVDRGLLLALLAEQREICSSCGHPMSQCRDPKTAGQWQVIEDICQPSRIAQATAENAAGSKRRGVVLMTRRT